MSRIVCTLNAIHPYYAQVGIVKALVKSNEFGVLWRYLVTEAREARLDKRMELAQLEDDLEDKEDRLQEATILYSSIVGPVDQLRFLGEEAGLEGHTGLRHRSPPCVSCQGTSCSLCLNFMDAVAFCWLQSASRMTPA